MALIQDVLARAHALGFDVVGVSPAGSPLHFAAFEEWLAAGRHGEMAYLARRVALRADSALLAPGARSIITVAANYQPGPPPSGWLEMTRGRFARYAWSADYHDAIRAALYGLDAFVCERTGRTEPGKACVDTAPLIERDFAVQAGLGFIGRNTCLITPGLGSWTFLAALLVPEALDAGLSMDAPRVSFRHPRRRVATGCGGCTRCLDACPTGALVAPYVLDARRCISYLTIEKRGSIPLNLRSRLGNWVFGCDICQEVCPYNRAAPVAAWPALLPDATRAAMPLTDLLALGGEGFQRTFRRTPVLRAKRCGLLRNACIAAGNSGDTSLRPILERLAEDPEPLVREHAAWALGCLKGHEARDPTYPSA